MLEPLHLIVETHVIVLPKRLYPGIIVSFVKGLVMAGECSLKLGTKGPVAKVTERILERQTSTEAAHVQRHLLSRAHT